MNLNILDPAEGPLSDHYPLTIVGEETVNEHFIFGTRAHIEKKEPVTSSTKDSRMIAVDNLSDLTSKQRYNIVNRDTDLF